MSFTLIDKNKYSVNLIIYPFLGPGALTDYINSLIGVLESLMQNNDIITAHYQNVTFHCFKWPIFANKLMIFE
jgi:hypothetical protein